MDTEQPSYTAPDLFDLGAVTVSVYPSREVLARPPVIYTLHGKVAATLDLAFGARIQVDEDTASALIASLVTAKRLMRERDIARRLLNGTRVPA